ncbi:MAG: amidase [Candidatus Binatia bacterium]
MTIEPWRLGAADLAAAIRQKEISSREALESLLARIAEVNPGINAISSVMADEARAAADSADAALARGEAPGPLHGVPVTVKVNVDVAGSATTSGMTAFADDRPAADAPLVARLRAAGAIPFARTNMPDLGLRWHTESSLHGVTINPWNPGRTPGGSSGGEAAAVATGMTPLGIGNDVGGSVRWPSQCCGTAALRPTLGRFPHFASTLPIETPIAFTMFLTDGPMARHVRDLKLALEVGSGQSPLDPWSVSPALTKGGRPLRVAVTTDPGGLGCDAAIAGGVARAADLLRKAGCIVEYADPPVVGEAHELWGTLLGAETSTLVVPFIETMLADDARTVIRHLVGGFPAVDMAGYMEGLGRRTRIAREWGMFFERYDLILGPVSCRPPFSVGDDLTGDGMADIMRGMRLVTACNLLGLPAAVVPVGVEGGMPLAVQVIAGRFRDEDCLGAAGLLEESCGILTPIDPRS